MVVVCSLAAAAGTIVLSARNGRPHSAATPLALANQLPFPIIVKCGWSGFNVSGAISMTLSLRIFNSCVNVNI